MIAPDGKRDELLGELLLGLDEQLSGETPGAELDTSAIAGDAQQIEQWEADRRCLELLHRVRRQWSPDDPSGDTPGAERAALDTAADGVPTMLGRFHILRELGRGGLGVVYLAYDPKLHRQVALKIPRPESLLSAGMRRRFLREAEAAARLNHPHLVAVYDSGEDRSVCYIASEFCPGPTLAAWLRQRGEPVPIPAAARIVKALAEAVGHAHGRGVLHRDIKPSNVMLSRPEDGWGRPEAGGGRLEGASDEHVAGSPSHGTTARTEKEYELLPKLTDFGMAKLLEREGDHTRSGVLVGTPAYMAPEQARGNLRELDARTDVYALGAILYEVLAGRRVFASNSDVEALRQVLFEEPTNPRTIRPEIPRDLEAICLKCLAKSSDVRYATAMQLADDLDRFLAGKPTVARPLNTLARTLKWVKRRPALAALWGVVAAFAVVLLAVVVAYNSRLSDEVVRADAARDFAERESAASRRLLYTADIRVAYETLKANNVEQALAILDRHAPKPGETDLREFAWHALREQCLPTTLNLVGHENDVFAVAFSPDGKRLATAGKDRTARLWDSATGQLLHTLRGHSGEVTSVAFAPDGKYLATASEDGTILVWTVKGQSDRTCAVHTDHALAVAWSHDGRRLASGGRDHTVRLWDFETSKTIATFEDRLEVVRALAFSPTDDKLFIADEAGTLHVWNLVEDRPEPGHTIDREKLFALALSHDGALVATAGRREEVYFWNADRVALEPPKKLLSHTEWIYSLAFAPGDYRLASASRDRAIHIWTPGQSLPQRTLLGHRGYVWSVAWSPDGRQLASAAADGVRVWSPRGAESIYPLSNDRHEELDFFPDSTRFATASSSDGIVRIWDCAQQVRAGWFEAHPRGRSSNVRVSPDGQLIATRSRDQTKIWRSDSFELVRTLETSAAYLPLAWAPDGRRLAITEPDNIVAIVNVDTGQVERRLEHGFPVREMAFTHDGRYLASTGTSLDIWDMRAQRVVSSIAGTHGDVTAARDRDLIAASSGSNVTLVDLAADPPQVSTLVTRGNKVTHLMLDGPTLAVIVDPPAGVSLWDVHTRQFLMELPCEAVRTDAGAFSPDGKHLVVVGNQDGKGAIREWTVRGK